jgi:hypothetical protein
MEEDRMPKKDLHSRTGRDETKWKTQERMDRGSRKRSSSARNERMERVGDVGKNGRMLFDRSKPTAGCSDNGRRRRRRYAKTLRKVQNITPAVNGNS